MISSCIIAFAMYSKIPMPRVKWTDEKMKYAICFFPLIGMVIGVIVFLASALTAWLGFGNTLKTVLLIMIPVAVTGGIHLDGLLDTIDARSSYQEREKKLEILKDSHAGAFAIIGCVVYFVLTFGFWSEISEKTLLLVGIGFVYSRALSGIGAVSLTGARKKGMLASFSSTAKKKVVQAVMIMYLFFCVLGMVLIHPIIGSVCVIAGGLTFCYYRHFAYREFGGITGDLAGFFLQVCELVLVIAAVITEKLLLIF